ncbi:hypothetical protein ES703_77148 [subsurface metagenome]
MAFKIITISFDNEKESFLEEELNRFFLNKRILDYYVEFFSTFNKAYRTVFIEYEQVIDKESKEAGNLSEEEELFYKRLREWRKQKAEEIGLPVYIICTNNQLRDVVKEVP